MLQYALASHSGLALPRQVEKRFSLSHYCTCDQPWAILLAETSFLAATAIRLASKDPAGIWKPLLNLRRSELGLCRFQVSTAAMCSVFLHLNECPQHLLPHAILSLPDCLRRSSCPLHWHCSSSAEILILTWAYSVLRPVLTTPYVALVRFLVLHISFAYKARFCEQVSTFVIALSLLASGSISRMAS